MLSALLAAAAIAGLTGSPHCIAMCGAGCAAVGRTPRQALAFHVGRLAGYAALGAAVAASVGTLQWGAAQLVVLKPFWAMFHVAVAMLGLSLIARGVQPAWLERGAQWIWRAARMRTLGLDALRWPMLAGALWALLPCGLLYAALLLAALADRPLGGAAVMATFAAASGAGMQCGTHLLKRAKSAWGHWGVRVAGLALASSSAWALWVGLRGADAWCR